MYFPQVKKHFADVEVVQVLYFYCCVLLHCFTFMSFLQQNSSSFMNIFIDSVSVIRSRIFPFSKAFSFVHFKRLLNIGVVISSGGWGVLWEGKVSSVVSVSVRVVSSSCRVWVSIEENKLVLFISYRKSFFRCVVCF